MMKEYFNIFIDSLCRVITFPFIATVYGWYALSKNVEKFVNYVVDKIW